jgi:hypothetical protein
MSLLFLLTQWTRKISKEESIMWRKFGALIGSINFLRAQILRASLYLRRLQSDLVKGVKLNCWSGWGLPSRKVLPEIRFWWRNIYYNTPFSFAQPIPRALIMTDASDHGWGAVLWFAGTYQLTYGSFSSDLDSSSSNRRETTAVLRALLYWKSVLEQLKGQAITIRSDNMVTVFNLQRQGASECLLYETRQIFSLLLQSNVRISVSHVQGVNNVTAGLDALRFSWLGETVYTFPPSS